MLKYNAYSSYLTAAFTPTEQLVNQAQEVLSGVEYDTMIGTGLSGGLVVPVLARLLDKHFALVRKDNDSGHRERSVEGGVGARWIFVDDFISTGTTFNRVQKEMEGIQQGQPWGWEKFTTKFVGTYQYARMNFVPAGRNPKEF